MPTGEDVVKFRGMVNEPRLHRSGVTAADSSDPADSSGAIDCAGHEQVRFDLFLASGSLTSMTVQALFWNSRQSKWMRGGSRTVTELPSSVVVAARGAKVYLKVTALAGSSPNVSIDYVLN